MAKPAAKSTSGRPRGRPAKSTSTSHQTVTKPSVDCSTLNNNRLYTNDLGPALETMDDTQLVVFTLRSILQDPVASPAAKASAARTLAEISGALGKHAKPPADDSKPLASMSRAELEAELANEG